VSTTTKTKQQETAETRWAIPNEKAEEVAAFMLARKGKWTRDGQIGEACHLTPYSVRFYIRQLRCAGAEILAAKTHAPDLFRLGVRGYMLTRLPVVTSLRD